MTEPAAGAAQPLAGLSSAEAGQRLAQYGPNAVSEERQSPLLAFLGKFWDPVPWMLEAAVILEAILRKKGEAIIIAALLLVNAVLSFLQENRANRALALLRSRLAVRARVRRDGHWQQVPAEVLVPGDVIHLRMGDLSPADVHLADGQVLLDQSALTGESLPVEAGAGGQAYAGAVVKRGEATGEVTATGANTYFGKTAELVRTAKTVSHLQTVIFTIVKYLVAVDAALAAALLFYAVLTGLSLTDMLPFVLILLVASVPAALPATFTLATALGARELAHRGVLVTRLSAIEEAAAMDVLASDKTGTITENRLALAGLRPLAPYGDLELMRVAALACDEATQDPIDIAILEAARARSALSDVPQRLQFIPFDPATKRSEAVFENGSGQLRVAKGAVQAVASLCTHAPDLDADVSQLAAKGYRVLAAASGTGNDMHLLGLLALQDPPRADSKDLIDSLRALGVRVVMVTGDDLATAQAVASQVGVGERACPPEVLHGDGDASLAKCDVFARVFPEDKFHLVQALQRRGHVVGMTGDGVNDAPALKQAEVGIAVSSATDVAKASASLVLTNPGLSNAVAAVETSRRIYQRMLTYTLNKIIKTIQVAVFLTAGVMLTGTFVVTPMLIVLLLFTNDFATMSLATDQVAFSQRPDRWNIRTLVLTGGAIACLVLVLSFVVFYGARDWLQLPLPQMQTLIFVMLVFSGQGTVYLVRERRHFWQSRPGGWLLLSSVGDIVIVSLFASRGILMTAIPFRLVAGMLGIVAAFMVVADFFKIRVFRALAWS